MANWCFSRVTIVGPEEEITKLDQKIDEIPRGENDKYGLWLGSILKFLGDWKDEDENPPCSCRGTLNYKEAFKDTLTLDIESAWSPHLGAISRLVNRYAPSAEIVYEAEEPGMCLYLSNDPDTVGNYCLDVWDNYEVPNAFTLCDRYCTKRGLRSILAEALNPQNHALTKDLIQEAIERWGDFININEFEYASIEEVSI